MATTTFTLVKICHSCGNVVSNTLSSCPHCKKDFQGSIDKGIATVDGVVFGPDGNNLKAQN